MFRSLLPCSSWTWSRSLASACVRARCAPSWKGSRVLSRRISRRAAASSASEMLLAIETSAEANWSQNGYGNTSSTLRCGDRFFCFCVVACVRVFGLPFLPFLSFLPARMFFARPKGPSGPE
eukprot:1936896-Pyramimonas_sp.AAC.1